MYQHLFYNYLLYIGIVLHVLTFPRSSSGESEEYQSKFMNWVTLIWTHILQFGFVFNSAYTFVKCNLTIHTKNLVMYTFYLSLRLFKANIYYNSVFNINQYINVVCPWNKNSIFKVFKNVYINTCFNCVLVVNSLKIQLRTKNSFLVLSLWFGFWLMNHGAMQLERVHLQSCHVDFISIVA
jgi:hypothetical protein